MNTETLPLVVRAKKAALMLGIGESQFWRKVKANELPQPVQIGGSKRWRIEDIVRTKRDGFVPDPPMGPPKFVVRKPGVHLYRHFDAKGTLLYVGISLSAVNRLAAHRDASSWYWSIATVTIEVLPTREAAEEAERLAIRKERPLFNHMHGDRARRVLAMELVK